uniref:Phosphatidylinositol transfer protein membrane associated 2 n=1 Tax=Oncorhynchus kisutch TaxID=8019 RepID=A0A8C7FG09_ONCKI
MLIKEYRIPMPMSVEEYRIAQLYMIQKKSREESCGEGSGVEILENKPYEDGPGGSGQYTHKVYHIGKHIPSWFCSILPQAALRVEEESWNAYPYTRTRYTCPFVEKFSIDIETYYKPDTGTQECFNLSSGPLVALSQLYTAGISNPIDIVKDYIAPHEYLVEEDPKLYVSVKTQRGPLTDDWIEMINQNPTQNPVMCAYKLCKVEFRYWGMQSKIERFIHDVGLRKVMVRAHRQAWCWQDEWYGLTIEDIRQLELETQLALATKMAQYSLSDTEEGAAESNRTPVTPDRDLEGTLRDGGEVEGGGAGLGDTLHTRGELTKQWSTSSRSSNRSSKRGGSPVNQNISEWRMQSIARDSEDSTDDEFFDAPEDFSGDEEMLLHAKEMNKWSSNDLMDKIETTETDEGQGRSTHTRTHTFRSSFIFQIFISNLVLQECLTPSKIHVLVLVLHGGNILDTGAGEPSSKQADVNTLSGAFETVMRVHYPAALGRIAIRMVPCPAVCADAFSQVSNLSPYSFDEGCLSNSQDHIPLAALPLLATSAPQYQDAVATVIQRANQVYGDFIRSLEGASFSGQVCVIGDCVGGILGFDALCSSNVIVSESQNSSRRGSTLPPFCVPRYQRFPLGDGHSALLGEDRYTHTHQKYYPSSPLTGPPHSRGPRRSSEASIASQVSGMADSYTASNITNIASRWWGSKRMDYALYCPDALTAFPTVALPHLFHASYWESTDVVSFLLRQVMRHENSSILELDGKEVTEFKPSKPREKWLRKRTHVKIRNVTANHRVNDAVFTEDGTQLVMGRFMYGPLDMVTLTGEKIDIHIMTQPPSGEWMYFDTELTNSSGRISYVIPESKRLGIGVYPVKLVVRGDHTFADSYLTVLPRGTEFVVFSIDGSFAASVSIMGSDPKVRAGAVDVVRHWQDLGYLIVYVTGRPDMQKQRVVAWLSQHNFPHGIVSFCDGLVHDPLRHKANFLKSLICEIFAAYGSTKDISVYSSIGLPPSHIYIVGRPTKKMSSQCQFIPDGYASHLSQLEYNQRSRPAKTASARIVLRKGSFGLGAAGGDYLRKRNHILRSINPTGGVVSSSSGQPGRTERTLSQCEVEREKAAGTQRSMSIAAGCWGRTGSTKEESGGLLSPK